MIKSNESKQTSITCKECSLSKITKFVLTLFYYVILQVFIFLVVLKKRGENRVGYDYICVIREAKASLP